MKDMFGTKIEVGDTIAYTSNPGYGPRMTVGTVVETDEKTAKVERIQTGCGESYDVKDGMTQKWVYDYATKKGEHVPVKARPTRIGMGDRCLIVKKATQS